MARRYAREVRPETLDHVALWVADRDAIAAFVTERLGMHVVDRTDTFTLVGSDARRGKLTLFAADGPRERGLLKHVAFRVSDLGRSLGRLDGAPMLERREAEAYFDVTEGLRLGLVEAPTDVEYDLDHVALFSRRPRDTAAAYRSFGFASAPPGRSRAPRVTVGGAFLELHDGEVVEGQRPLLNHLAVRVESVDEHIAAARDRGVEIEDVVDAANTYAVFVRGPERVRIEYVEHKASFSLR